MNSYVMIYVDLYCYILNVNKLLSILLSILLLSILLLSILLSILLLIPLSSILLSIILLLSILLSLSFYSFLDRDKFDLIPVVSPP